MTSDENIEKTEDRVYELGYHLVSTIPEEKLAAEVSTIKDALTAKGAVFISEDFPKLRPLAYKMEKVIGARHLKFDTAHFGWVKFEVNPEALADIKKVLDLNDSILRYLLIKTVRENTMAVLKAPMYRTEAKPIPGSEAKKGDEPKVEVSEMELDKSIEKLIV